MPHLFVIGIVLVVSLVGQDITFLFQKSRESLLFLKERDRIEAEGLHRKSDLFDADYRTALGLGYGRDDGGGEKGMEYEVSAGRDLFVGGDLKGYFSTVESYTEYRLRLELNKIKIELWRLYGNYCLLMRSLQAKGKLGEVYDEIARHIDTGVRLGEFSASDSIMAHLSLDKLNLEISQLEPQLAQIEGKIKQIVPEFDGEFICRGLRPDFDSLFSVENSLLWKLFSLKEKGLREELRLHGVLRRIGIDLTLTRERDGQGGMVTFSIPLSLSPSAQMERAAILKELSALLKEVDQLKIQYGQDTRVLKERLRVYRDHVSRTEHSIELSADTLIRQSQMRFKAGEEGLMEMLKAVETKLALLETILQLKLKRRNIIADYMERYGIDIERVLPSPRR
ncbi:MAG: hypothetical protein GXO19_01785 [Epsilonproteobacteria bacterium]|nr:hypothetical protein [Campylobacterota bacterium]NPA56447.1 hypothetical protein [Campylobacterota bacterium]